ncbi:hypothetical protein [Poriferisphaera corsica]|uniref:hypothetical protein n=1 Tax=Poriferisphaera corsica TaxID=2528020 RepID=UPI0011A5851E|nr:hypothetical protein [Poriferisphaera corsica]
MLEGHHYIIGKPNMNGCPFGDKLQHQWIRRHQLFERFDQGIIIDRSGLSCAKPEIAAHRLAAQLRGNRIFIAHPNLGITAIACAIAGKQVLTATTDHHHVHIAKHNASIYNIDHQITFLEADPRQIMRDAKPRDFDAIILDPPFPPASKTSSNQALHLHDFDPPLTPLLQHAASCSSQIALLTPSSLDLNPLSQYASNIHIHNFAIDNNTSHRTILLWN